MENKKAIRVISVKYLYHYAPNASCGTGYDEPDIYELTTDTGDKYKLSVSMWYRPYDSFRQQAEEAITFMLDFKGVYIENKEEVIELLRKEYLRVETSTSIPPCF